MPPCSMKKFPTGIFLILKHDVGPLVKLKISAENQKIYQINSVLLDTEQNKPGKMPYIRQTR
jgi:hypothetical protein